MSSAKKEVIERWFSALNSGNVSVLDDLADEFYTEDSILHDPAFTDLEPGPAGVKQFVRQVLNDLPDGQITLEDTVEEGDKIATRFTVRGMDASTGEPVNLSVITISRFAGGKIAEEWQLAVPSKPE